MGQVASCIDPAREHPPYSWPKDHPGRAEAIAELKRKRRERSLLGKNAKSADVPKQLETDNFLKQDKQLSHDSDPFAASTPETDNFSARPDHANDIAVQKSQNATNSSSTESQDTPVADSAPEIDIAANHGDSRAVGNIDSQQHDAVTEATSPRSTAATLASDVVADPQREDTDVASEPTQQNVQEPSSTMPKHMLENFQDTTPSSDKPNIHPMKIPDPDATPAQKSLPHKDDSPRVNEQHLHASGPRGKLRLSMLEKAAFDSSEDKLPDAKHVEQGIHDPVTGEVVSQDEFRRRVQTRGLVRQHVSKFEFIDEKAARDRAEIQAQHDARAKQSRKNSKMWGARTSSYISEPDRSISLEASEDTKSVGNPSSPIPVAESIHSTIPPASADRVTSLEDSSFVPVNEHIQSEQRDTGMPEVSKNVESVEDVTKVESDDLVEPVEPIDSVKYNDVPEDIPATETFDKNGSTVHTVEDTGEHSSFTTEKTNSPFKSRMAAIAD